MPFGSDLRMEIGRASASSSIMAVWIGPLYCPSMGTKAGAPIAICSERAPTIRALSKRVSLGGPILISNSAKDGCLAFFTVFAGDIREPRGWLRPTGSEDKSFSPTPAKTGKGKCVPEHPSASRICASLGDSGRIVCWHSDARARRLRFIVANQNSEMRSLFRQTEPAGQHRSFGLGYFLLHVTMNPRPPRTAPSDASITSPPIGFTNWPRYAT